MSRMARWPVFVAAAGVLTACDNGIEGVAFSRTEVDLIGFWTGTAEITHQGDHVSSMPVGNGGFRFPAAIQFADDQSFVYHSAHYPVTGQAGENRRCDGAWVFAIRTQAVQLFPDRLCRALPLVSYTVRRSGAARLVLEGHGTEFGATGASVRVRLFLERVDEPLGVGVPDDG